MLNKIIKFFLENKLVTVLLLLIIVGWGILVAPFRWVEDTGLTSPVAVDAIPDIGENQQIVYTEWTGRSPQDVEDQITYPLTTALLGIPGVKTIRSSSMFGFSTIYIIFNEDVEFYWSRSRILEKLNSLSSDLIPEGVQPTLGPDATALGQVFWYTLEGRNANGEVTAGWDLHELRTIQDYQIRYSLASVEGVAEVASIGGYVKEYQVDVDPAALKQNDITLMQVMNAIQSSNLDVGARTIEINQAEYFVRGIGYIKNLEDLNETVVTSRDNVPIRIKDVARVQFGPAPRRGVLDKGGAEVVGGVVVARYGANPLEVIENVKSKIEEISAGLPEKRLDDGELSKVTLVPFYDRTRLINETLGTLEEALTLEVLITILVVIVMVINLRASLLISALLPIAILMTFIGMRYFGVDANIVALSGIAIAIGTVVDMGIILTENMLRHFELDKGKTKLKQIYEATIEVAPAVITAIATTVVSFVPVFALEASEGKLFRPLAFTKTFVLIASLVVSLLVIPAFAHWFFGTEIKTKKSKLILNALLIVAGVVCSFFLLWAGIVLIAFGMAALIQEKYPEKEKYLKWSPLLISIITIVYLLASEWLPLGAGVTLFFNFLFVLLLVGVILLLLQMVVWKYEKILSWCLNNKKIFLVVPAFIVLLGITIWVGFASLFGWVATSFDRIDVNIRTTGIYRGLVHTFPGVEDEFMPSLDEGSFLLMPTSMPHSGVEYNEQVLQLLDMRVNAIPEVEMVVGKLGRVESPLDPAPISMFENVIQYRSEYAVDESGNRLRFRVDDEGRYELHDGTFYNPDEGFQSVDVNDLIADPDGEYLRQWRPEITSPDDIWREIEAATNIPGVTSAPKLQPIETRQVMLQTGMRAPMGIKVQGPSLDVIENFGFELERILKEVPKVKSEAVFADRIVGKPYLRIIADRQQLGRYGLSVEQLQMYLQTAIGGMQLELTVEGRQRFPVRMRYPRELRDNPEAIGKVLIPTPDGTQIPLENVAEIEYQQGPQAIKSENTFLVGYVLFDRMDEFAEVEVVEQAQQVIQDKIDSGELQVPEGVSFQFSGTYENQVRAEKRLSLIVPLVLVVIFLILYFQFRSVPVAMMIFTGIAVAFSGGFIMIWLYGIDSFMNFELFGTNVRGLFNMGPINLSVAVWVGFIALFGIATDDGVVISTYLKQVFKKNKPLNKKEVRLSVLEAGSKRVRATMMTTATTVIALLPILTSTGRGADIMIPMAIPAVGGMMVAVITMFVVPTLYCWWEERKVR